MDQAKSTTARKITIWLPLLLALVLVGGMLIGMQLQPAARLVDSKSSLQILERVAGQGKVEELIRYIEAKYVEEVDRDALVDEAIQSVLKQLDPHSNYIPAEQLEHVNAELEGNFEGIGVEFMLLDDTIVVVSALNGGPSEAAGILAGDKIVMVEDSVIAGVNMSSAEIVGLLRGEKGTTVQVGVLRGREDKVRHFDITRDKIPLRSVDVAYMVDKKTGYIKVNRFSATTHEEFMTELERLVDEEGMEDLIIDLRHNPGGYLQQATKMLSQLFPRKGKLLVYTEGESVSRNDYKSSGRALFPIDEVVVLIDEGSASASEIVAGAVQDHDRGLIVGRRSFGKGLVQEQYRLRDGSALRLTVARYYTPSGRSIQKPYDDLESYRNDMLARLESGELVDGEMSAPFDSTEYYTHNGRVVYGGGGITPDLFVAMDSIYFDETYIKLRQAIPSYAYRYVEASNDDLAQWSLEDFLEDYALPDAVFNRFLREEQVPGRLDPRLGDNLRRFMKARIGQHLFGEIGFYRVWHQEDAFLKEALHALRSQMPITSTH